MTFLTTLTGILDFANLIFQTGIFSQFKLGKKSNWVFQTGECQKFQKSQCRQIGGVAAQIILLYDKLELLRFEIEIGLTKMWIIGRKVNRICKQIGLF